MQIHMNPIPSDEWERRYAELRNDSWLRKKTDRNRRLKEQREYLDEHVPQLRHLESGYVVDLGCGPGELLEICRSFGHRVLGVDAPSGDGGMGDPFVEYSRLMHERQGIPVCYDGLQTWLGNDHGQYRYNVVLFNARGSLAQMFSRYMLGDPHHEHHDSRRLSWPETARMRELLTSMFTTLRMLLRFDGTILIHENTPANAVAYDAMLRAAAEAAGLRLVKQEGLTIHAWMKGE